MNGLFEKSANCVFARFAAVCEPPTRFAITSHCTDPLREEKYLEYFNSHALHLCESADEFHLIRHDHHYNIVVVAEKKKDYSEKY